PKQAVFKPAAYQDRFILKIFDFTQIVELLNAGRRPANSTHERGRSRDGCFAFKGKNNLTEPDTQLPRSVAYKLNRCRLLQLYAFARVACAASDQRKFFIRLLNLLLPSKVGGLQIRFS
ncbi:MAG: hypothetical protein LPK19_11295, partial [Hymenobacteraceae bacterium]|nr:hypothetical protein [Hymenobacteraceae bacterium]MDX5396813.1 hypothetical protein [Hymenobacteraceae bacterium]MDX5512881.1 hypothetical protein [Hymenobacteraceae bacterium]